MRPQGRTVYGRDVGRSQTSILLVGAVVALAGCGGGDGETKADKPAPRPPTPSGTVDRAAQDLARAIASGDCRRLAAIAQHSSKRAPALSLSKAPPTRDECARMRRFARTFRGFAPTGATRAFGTGAIADGRVGRNPITAVFVLDLDGRWKTAIASGSNPQVGTRPPGDSRLDANVAKFVEAARADDCAEVFRLLSADSEVHERTGSTRAAYCRALRQAPDDPRSFFRRLKQDPDAKPFPLGKTAEFAFYGLALKTGVYYTLFAARQPANHPVTPAHERDAVYNWYLARE